MILSEAHALFRELCDGSERFVLTTHINPDGDALGSQFSLARFLASRGKQVRIINQDATPDILSFIEDAELPVEIYEPATHDPIIAGADLVVLVDNSAPDRLGEMESPMLAAADHTLCIDHHPSRETPWAHHILDEDASAAAAMIFELTRPYHWTPDARSAAAMYVGLATDTGFFRFNSTNARSHEVAAELLRLGADPAKTFQSVYERNSLAYTRLLGHALVGLTLEAGGAIVLVKITLGQLKALDAEQVDTSEITTSLLAMDGVRLALLFRELPGGRIKVSLRSKGDLDVHRLAATFGGGGHRNASGIVMPGELNEVVKAVTHKAASLLAAGG